MNAFEKLCDFLVSDNIKEKLLSPPLWLLELIPEITPCIGFDQINHHHIYDVWEHTVTAIALSVPDRLIRAALLLHDLGKPGTFTIDEAGEGHFDGHVELSTEIARKVLSRLGAPEDISLFLTGLVRLHDLRLAPTEENIKRITKDVGASAIEALTEVWLCDNAAQAPEWSRKDSILEFRKKAAAINN